MEITDKWLMEMGGWQAMKTARALWSAGAVSGAALDGQRLTGTVRDAGKDLPSGLLIKGRSDVETLCQCFLARRDGILCAHSLAVGIAWAHRHEKPPQAAAASNPANTRAAPAAQPAPLVAQATGPLTFLLNSTFFDGLRKHRLSVIVEQGAPDPAAQSADTRVLRWLGSLLQKTVPPHLMLGEPRQTTDLLQAIAGHPRIFLKDGAKRLPLTLSPEPARLPLHVTAGAEGNVRLSLAAPSAADLAPPAVAGSTGWLWRREERALAPVRVPDGAFEILQTLPPGRPLEKPRRWLARHLSALQEFFQLELPESLTFRLMPGAPRFELLLEGSLERLTARLRCRYDNGPVPFPPGAPDMDAFPLESPDSPDRFLTRNLPAEAAALRRLTAAGFQDSEPGELLLKGENAVLQFFAGELERLKAVWDVTLGTRFAAASAKVERLAPKWTAVGSGTDWLAFDLAFAGSGGTTFDRVEIARLLATGSGHKKLANGRTAVVSLADAMDLNEVLRDARPDQESGHFRVKRTQLGYLEQTFGRAADAGLMPTPPPPVPAEILGLLRDYQKTGVDWLLAQAGQGTGGILADEMGLGKTLQSLAAIAALRSRHPDKPALVVCPKSLLGNWAEEAARFVPGLKVLTLEGTRRANRFADIPAAAIVITSYQLLARDIDHHREVEWGAVFLDEAGFIRNPETQAAKAACELRAGVRFALTGTPIENGVRDLWSLMRFAVPGYLGPRDDFRERYEAPLTAGGAPAVMARLRRRMAPYILRRLKEEVAKDLPSKIEKILTCPLTDTQRGLYTGLMREGAAKVQDAESAKQKNQARLHMLTTLLRLRQTCCDPRLLGADLPKMVKDEALSGKLEALAELLEEIRDGGHSVIIFSAFASMLRLLKETVDAAGLGWCHIDGQTNDRAAQVAAFRDDPDKRVFLISLKAGGFGLNLTKADTVIHFDPWWNPAVEAQATDRAHRIGQSRPVTVYKLITAGTVEEKILALQRKKRGLMDAALDDEAPMMEGLTDDDLRGMVLG